MPHDQNSSKIEWHTIRTVQNLMPHHPLDTHMYDRSLPWIHTCMTVHSPGYTHVWPLTPLDTHMYDRSLPWIHTCMTAHSPGLLQKHVVVLD
jgi:hypothetical protein